VVNVEYDCGDKAFEIIDTLDVYAYEELIELNDWDA
jgi:hypothetical protein